MNKPQPTVEIVKAGKLVLKLAFFPATVVLWPFESSLSDNCL